MHPLTIAYITSVSQILALNAQNQAVKSLNQLGLRLLFTHVPKGWIPCLHPTDLTSTWQKAGLPVEGVGYATIGSLSQDRRTSNRFWPTSPFYQAWLGGYLFQTYQDYGGSSQNDPDFEALVQVMLEDQRRWLSNYGCSGPQISIPVDGIHQIEKTTHQDYPAWLVQGTFLSQSDVGAGNRYGNGYLYYRTNELMFARFGGVKLPPLSTLPPVWPLASYHSLELNYFGLLVRIGAQDRWALLYCCGSCWAGRDYFPVISSEALATLRQSRIISA